MFGKRTAGKNSRPPAQVKATPPKSQSDMSSDPLMDFAKDAQKHEIKQDQNFLTVEAQETKTPVATEVKNSTPAPINTVALSQQSSGLSTKEVTKTSVPQAQAKVQPQPALKPKKLSPPTISQVASPRNYNSGRSQELADIRTRIYANLIETIDVSRLAQMEKDEAAVEISEVCLDIIAARDYAVGSNEQRIIIDEICDEILGYGPLEPLLARDDIADIMVNGYDQVFIETGGRVEDTGIRFRSNRQLLEICQRMVSKVGRRVDESSPICDARLLDGSRVNVIAPPLSVDGVNLTIRKFKKDKLRMKDLVQFGAVSPDGGKLLQIIGACRCNVIISGGTGSGKTTLLNCLSSFAAEDERIITCEDSAELQLQQPHVVRLETRPPSLEGSGEVTMRDLVKNCLRMRPERIIVGEVRGPEAFDLLQAMNTGHDGSMGTLHANSPREAMSRLEAMITMGGFGLPVKVIREMICSAVDIIIQTQRLRDGSRRITHVTEVLGMEESTVTTQDILTFDVTGEDQDGNLIGKHMSSGVGRPKFRQRALEFSLAQDLDMTMNSLQAEEDE